MSVPEHLVRNNRLKLLAIIALFMLPPLAAWVAWQAMDETGAGATTNAGTLVTPARPLSFVGLKQADGNPLDESALRGRWTYVIFANGACDERCGELLYLTRQIRLGMNKDIPRVQRLLVLDTSPSPEVAAELARDHEDLIWVIRDESAATLIQAFHGDGFAPDGEQSFLVDPLGNLMMVYGPEVPAKGMMKDLRKLLKISQIG